MCGGTVVGGTPSNIIPFRKRGGPATSTTWTECRDAYKLYLTVNFGKETPRTYYSTADLYSRWCDQHNVCPITATSQEVAEWFAWELRHHARSTAVTRMLALRNFYHWLKDQGQRTDNPTAGIRAWRPKRAGRDPYTPDELRRLFSAAQNGGYERANPLRDTALLLMFLDTGARRAEMLNLRVHDIDWLRSQMLIRYGKGGRERRVAFGKQASRALKRYIGDRDGPVWLNARGKPLTEPRAYELLRLIADKAGVAGAHIHKFRVTMANRLLAQAMPLDEVNKLMGHANLDTTAQYAAYSVVARALERQRKLSPADRLFRAADKLRKVARQIGNPTDEQSQEEPTGFRKELDALHRNRHSDGHSSRRAVG